MEDLTYRQIFRDGRPLPVDPNPTWMGYSVGRWEGNTLVVTSIGFNDRSLMDLVGHPHTEALRVTERFTRRDFGHMDVDVTLEDPKTLDKPVTLPMEAEFVADTELLEYVCQENERSRQRLVGTADDDKKNAVAVPAATLARYAGDYRLQIPDGPPRILTVYIRNGQLLMDLERGPTEMATIPVSQTRFMAQGRIGGISSCRGRHGVRADGVCRRRESHRRSSEVSDADSMMASQVGADPWMAGWIVDGGRR